MLVVACVGVWCLYVEGTGCNNSYMCGVLVLGWGDSSCVPTCFFYPHIYSSIFYLWLNDQHCLV